MGDKNAWVGIPVAVIPKAEARKELPIRYIRAATCMYEVIIHTESACIRAE